MGVVDAGGGESKLRMRIGTDTMTATSMDGALTIPTQKWTHVAMTYNGSELRSYVNGELDPNIFSVNGKIDTKTDSVTIGNVHTKTGGSAQDRHFEGMLDDVGIWNRSLTASEVESLAGPGNLTATTSINLTGTLKVTPVGTPATAGTFAVEVDSGEIRTPPNIIVGSGYDGPPSAEANPNVHITGTDVGTLKGFATVRSDGQLDINFTGKPDGTGNLTMTVDPGILRTTANLTVGSGYDGPPSAEPAPNVHITGTDVGTLKGFATVRADGELDINFTGTPSGPGALLMKIDDGLNKAPAILTVGSGYDGGPPTAETNPNVHITGADVGTLKGFATVRLDGQLDINFTGNPAGLGDLTMTVDNGTTQKPADINTPTIGAGYKTGETPPIVSFVGTNAGTLKGNAVIQTDGSLKINFTGAPDDTADITMNVADGTVRAPADLPGTGSGYTPGDTPPIVTLTGANKGTLDVPPGNVTINGSGSLDITFAGIPSDTNDVTIQIADGVGRLTTFSDVGSGYAIGETPTVTISGGIVSGTGTPTVNDGITGPLGTLNVDLSTVRPDDLSNRTLTIASGALRTPATLTGIGANHDPASPPAVTMSGADLGGVTVNNVTVNLNGTVDVSFAGAPSGTGPLTVQVAGGSGSGSSGSGGISSQYLLDINGDLWDYSVSEFEAFTELVSDARAQNGAEQNSLGTFWELLSTNVNKLEQAAGRIKDADFAKEMTELSKSQINSRSAAGLLGKQNRITSEALLTLQNLSNML
jgi:flagellin-like hook-associated protein FlgL